MIGLMAFSELNTMLLFALIAIVVIIFLYIHSELQKTDKRIKDIEETYKYLKFLDDTNLKIYEKYLKAKTKKEHLK